MHYIYKLYIGICIYCIMGASYGCTWKVHNRWLQDGRTALHYAASWGNVHALKSLLAGGASIRATDNNGRTALHWAADAPIKDLDEFVKAQAICEGASEDSLVLKQGM